MVIKTRARTDSAKAERRDQLVIVARELFEERGMSFSMLEVANAANLAKGTPYLYFFTKEELLLEVFIQELQTWFIALNQILDNPTNLAKQIAQSFYDRKTLISLFAVQVNILESNIKFDAALRFKTFLLEQAQAIAPKLETLMPKAKGIVLLQTLNALVIGLAQLSSPSSIVIQEILEVPAYEVLEVHFFEILETSLEALFAGLERS